MQSSYTACYEESGPGLWFDAGLWGTGGGERVRELRKDICSSSWASQWHPVIAWYWNGLPIDSYPFWYRMKGRLFHSNVCIFRGNRKPKNGNRLLFYLVFTCFHFSIMARSLRTWKWPGPFGPLSEPDKGRPVANQQVPLKQPVSGRECVYWEARPWLGTGRGKNTRLAPWEPGSRGYQNLLWSVNSSFEFWLRYTK